MKISAVAIVIKAVVIAMAVIRIISIVEKIAVVGNSEKRSSPDVGAAPTTTSIDTRYLKTVKVYSMNLNYSDFIQLTIKECDNLFNFVSFLVDSQ